MATNNIEAEIDGLLDAIEVFTNKIDVTCEESFRYITLETQVHYTANAGTETENLINTAKDKSKFLRSRLEVDAEYQSQRRTIIRVGGTVDSENSFETLCQDLQQGGVQNKNGGYLSADLESCRLAIESSEYSSCEGVTEAIKHLSQNQACSVYLSLQVSKDTLAEECLKETDLNGSAVDDYLPQFWRSYDALNQAIRQKGLTKYLQKFESKQQPVLFFRELSKDAPTSTIVPVFTYNDLGEIPQGKLTDYRQQVKSMVEFTAYEDETRPLPPAAFSPLNGCKAVAIPFTFGLFSLLSDRVESPPETGLNTYKFSVKTGSAPISGVVDLEEVVDREPQTLEKLEELYDAVSVHQNQETFIDLWRRSVSHHCSSLDELPTTVDHVIDRYRTFEEELVDSKLQDLSNAIRDVHTFMNDLVNQVTTTSANLSNELQRLTLTVAITLLTSFFLIAKQQSLPVTLSLSYLVFGLLILVYLPIVEERVAELDKLRKFTNEDFDAYRSIIREYAGNALEIEDLDERRGEYNRHVFQKVCDAQRRLRGIFGLTVLAGLVLSAYTCWLITSSTSQNIGNEDILFVGQTWVAILSGYLTYRARSKERLFYTYEAPSLRDSQDATSDEISKESESTSTTPTSIEKGKEQFLSFFPPEKLLFLAMILSIIAASVTAFHLYNPI